MSIRSSRPGDPVMAGSELPICRHVTLLVTRPRALRLGRAGNANQRATIKSYDSPAGEKTLVVKPIRP